jgi:hypothetical protein
MRQASFVAYIKKVEVVNKVTKSENGEDEQSLRVILEDVDITDENFLMLRRFGPGMSITVTISPYQLGLQDFPPVKDDPQVTIFKTSVSS